MVSLEQLARDEADDLRSCSHAPEEVWYHERPLQKLLELIQRTVVVYQVETGKKPGFVYLGSREYREVTEQRVVRHCHGLTWTRQGETNLTVMGLPVKTAYAWAGPISCVGVGEA